MNKLNFDYKPGDVVLLEDGLTAIIIHNGIYNNQYWCEVCYPDGLHLGAADYYSSDPTSYGVKIIGLVEDKRESIINAALLAMREFQAKHNINFSERMNPLLDFLQSESMTA